MVGIERRVSLILEEIFDDVSRRDEPEATDVLGRLASLLRERGVITNEAESYWQCTDDDDDL